MTDILDVDECHSSLSLRKILQIEDESIFEAKQIAKQTVLLN